jgi:hypothetical protein
MSSINSIFALEYPSAPAYWFERRVAPGSMEVGRKACEVQRDMVAASDVVYESEREIVLRVATGGDMFPRDFPYDTRTLPGY